ncbi:MAG: cation diffusion facilitator family transporter [Acidimicrobiales bacterium]
MTEDKDLGGHAQGTDPATDIRLVFVALALIVLFLTAEVVAAVIGNSLVLYADAGHMVTDVAALSLSLWAIKMAQRPARERWTYGFKRAEILAAASNGALLVAIAIVIGVEAVRRLIGPQHVTGGLVLAVASVGAVVNVCAVRALARADRRSLNLRAAFAHIVTDLYAFVATALSGLVILLTRWERADSIASMLVVVLMLWTAWGLLRDSGHILLQAAPGDLDLNDVRTHLAGVDDVLDVHDLHAWTLTSGSVTLSAHVTVEDRCFNTGHTPQILDALQLCLASHFDITHSTLQLEPVSHVDHESDVHR